MKTKFFFLLAFLLAIAGLEQAQAQSPIPLGMEDVLWQKEGLYVWSLAFSPTQPYVAVGTDKNIKIFNILDGSEITTLQTRTDDFILALQFSPNGEFLYSGSKWGQLVKWNTATWDSTVCVDYNNEYNIKSIGQIDYDINFNIIAIAGRGEGMMLYDINSNQIIKTWKDMPLIDPKFNQYAIVNTVSFRYDGKVIAIGMKDIDATWLYDIEKDSIIKKIKGEDGQYSPTKNEMIVKKIKEDSGTELLDGLDYYKFDESDVPININIGELSKEINFIFNNEGNKLIISGRKSNIKFFNLYNSQQSNEFIYEPGGSFIFLSLSGDNRYIASAHYSKIIMLDALDYLNVQDNIILNFNLYPNPSQDSMMIQYFLEYSNIVNISISDLQGNIISNIFMGLQEQGQHNLPFSTLNIANGHYFITIESNGQVISLPFEIIR